MPHVHTQTQLTVGRIGDVLKELRALKQSKYQRTYSNNKLASNRMVERIVGCMAVRGDPAGAGLVLAEITDQLIAVDYPS